MKPELAKLAGAALLFALSSTCQAAATQEQLARLGKDLTPFGAEMAGNKDGSIPAWTGGMQAPKGYDPRKGYIDPFAAEKPLHVITAANYAQFQAQLPPGQVELLKRYPGYKIPVYPSHRTHALPKAEYEAIEAEARNIKLAEGGNGLVNRQRSTVPFPFPASGDELFQNMLLRYRAQSLERTVAFFPVQTDGSFTPVRRVEWATFAQYLNGAEPNRLYYWMSTLLSPASVAGDTTLVHEPLDQVKETRKAWAYNPGSRRILRAPQIAYDNPLQGTDGLMTVDDYDGMNGAADRFDLKLVGKKELIVPYNNFKLTDKSLKYKEIVGRQTLNQDFTRYELHRVYVVEATLKPGARHVYGKRVLYIDEDSYQIVHADNYDGRGELWRVHEIFTTHFYDASCTWLAAEVSYDLQARRYVVVGVANEEKPYDFGKKLTLDYYSTDNLRRVGQ
jgi:hypothetical protein